MSGPPDAVPYWVLHVDLDQFLAAVEVLRHPELSGQPVVVGGRGDPTQRGAVAAAKRCPGTVFLPADNPHYEEVSERVMALLRDTRGADLEVLGWDEAFLGLRTADPEATDSWDEVMGGRPTRALWGIGSRTAVALAERGLHTVRELDAADPDALAAEPGPTLGPWYVQLGRGIGRREVSGTPWVRAAGRPPSRPTSTTGTASAPRPPSWPAASPTTWPPTAARRCGWR